MALYVRQLKLGPMENFVYLVGAADARETAIVDPAWDVSEAVRAASEDGRVLTHALVSHHHFDHVNGLPDVLAQGGIRVYAHRADVPKLAPELQREVIPVDAGDAVDVGPLAVRAFHTPGHTPGSTCWHAGGALFAGDTVFVNACGRCDLAGGDPEEMFKSLRRVAELPDDVTLYPGHDYGDVPVSSVAREKERNPYFQKLARLEDFVAYRMRPGR
jgi:glyoxylase-like metal-dependent hydrolase (beta-lactamase superfamily II)